MEQSPHVFNQTVAIANIDEPAEYYAQMRDTSNVVESYPAGYVILAECSAFFEIRTNSEELLAADFEEEMKIDTRIDCVDQEENGKKGIYEANVSSQL